MNRGRGNGRGRGGERIGGCGRVNGSFHGRGRRRGGGIEKVVNGVDIRDPNRFFTNE